MRHATTGRRLHGVLLLCAAAVACAAPLHLPPASRHQGDRPTSGQYGKPRPDTTTPVPKIAEVRVRYWKRSPDVSIVAWDPIESRYGLSVSLRPNGTLIRDHRVYVDVNYELGITAYPYATLGSRNLQMTGITRDDHNCWFGHPCSPLVSYGARIPDELLRAHQDSLAVEFYTGDRNLRLVFAKDFVRAYLAAVDSMANVLKATQHKKP